MQRRSVSGEQARNGVALVVVVVLCLGLGGLLTANFGFRFIDKANNAEFCGWTVAIQSAV